MEKSPSLRLDKWLWAVRFFKTRSLATDACRSNQIKMAGRPLKPGYTPKCGDLLSIRAHDVVREIRIVECIDKRVGAPIAIACYEDLTDPAELQRQKQHLREASLQRTQGSGRPGKKERRMLERFFGSA